MYCPECGAESSRPTKFCVRCGAALKPVEESVFEKTKERFDEYLEGLFWTAFLGIGLVMGGAVAFQVILHLSRGVILAYMCLSSAAFLIVFGLSLWQTIQIMREMKRQTETTALPPARNTNKMLPSVNDTPASVIEHTTRTLEPVTQESSQPNVSKAEPVAR